MCDSDYALSDTNRVITHEYQNIDYHCVKKGKTITKLNELSYLFELAYLFLDLICKKKISNVLRMRYQELFWCASVKQFIHYNGCWMS